MYLKSNTYKNISTFDYTTIESTIPTNYKRMSTSLQVKTCDNL